MAKAKVNVESTNTAKLEKKDVVTAQAVIDRLTDEGKEKKGKMANLPLVSSLYSDTEEMNRAIRLLKTGNELRNRIAPLEKEFKDAKDDITAVVIGAEVEGYRYGNLAVAVSTQTRTTLNREKLAQALLDEGVDAEVVGKCIKRAMVEGEPFYVVKFAEVG